MLISNSSTDNPFLSIAEIILSVIHGLLIIFLTVFLGTASLHVSSKYSLYLSKKVEKLVGLVGSSPIRES